LLAERALVEDKDLPISSYNYSAMRDRLRDQGAEVSVPTIIKHAKQLGCYKSRKKRKVHAREVLTASIGALVQHDSSLHLWSPFSKEKWYLVTSIDDYSRMLLYADFIPAETTWAHIQAVRAVVERFGVPLRYYVDSLRVFRFVQGRDSVWRRHVLETDDTLTQWGQMMQRLGVEVIHALSPQAKGKVERPFRWLHKVHVLRRTASCAPVPMRGWAALKKCAKCSTLKSTATITAKCTLPPGRSRPSVSAVLSRRAIASFASSRSPCLSAQLKMSFAYAPSGKSTAIASSRYSSTRSK